MIHVRIRTILTLKKVMGSGEIQLSLRGGTTLRGLVATLVDRWGDELASRICEPEGENLLPYIRLMVNGRDIAFLNRMDTVLQDGDEILILPPVSGG